MGTDSTLPFSPPLGSPPSQVLKSLTSYRAEDAGQAEMPMEDPISGHLQPKLTILISHSQPLPSSALAQSEPGRQGSHTYLVMALAP
ncbi:hypothetical protein JZ751_024198 [Albula glossodonta]|uniref:Uncharacterized protein n=1 Tax=Albula glossodonta TaxID=121402 RepID=A0A8T2MQY7_9TELE|nr:hypothetical protein JZ751_024198 [Albula glossodonta]